MKASKRDWAIVLAPAKKKRKIKGGSLGIYDMTTRPQRAPTVDLNAVVFDSQTRRQDNITRENVRQIVAWVSDPSTSPGEIQFFLDDVAAKFIANGRTPSESEELLFALLRRIMMRKLGTRLRRNRSEEPQIERNVRQRVGRSASFGD
jgi:uncharacterized protein (UPF0218 family)